MPITLIPLSFVAILAMAGAGSGLEDSDDPSLIRDMPEPATQQEAVSRQAYGGLLVSALRGAEATGGGQAPLRRNRSQGR